MFELNQAYLFGCGRIVSVIKSFSTTQSEEEMFPCSIS